MDIQFNLIQHTSYRTYKVVLVCNFCHIGRTYDISNEYQVLFLVLSTFNEGDIYYRNTGEEIENRYK